MIDCNGIIKNEAEEVLKSHFRYLRSLVDKEVDIQEDVRYSIAACWQKWRSASGVLCDR